MIVTLPFGSPSAQTVSVRAQDFTGLVPIRVTLVPDDAQPHADSIVVGYAEDEWPKLLRDFAAGRLHSRYTQSPDLDLAGFPPIQLNNENNPTNWVQDVKLGTLAPEGPPSCFNPGIREDNP